MKIEPIEIPICERLLDCLDTARPGPIQHEQSGPWTCRSCQGTGLAQLSVVHQPGCPWVASDRDCNVLRDAIDDARLRAAP